MSRKIKVLISTLVAVLLLTVGGTAVVMANEEAVPEVHAGANITLARVAEILDIPPEELMRILKQAWQEMSEEWQTTGNCSSICQERVNRFKEQRMEKRQERTGNKQEMGTRFQGDRPEGQKTGRFRVSQAVRG